MPVPAKRLSSIRYLAFRAIRALWSELLLARFVRGIPWESAAFRSASERCTQPRFIAVGYRLGILEVLRCLANMKRYQPAAST